VDLEKAFDRVPREMISWAMRKLGVEEWLVSAVMSMYSGAKTVVRTVYGRGLKHISACGPRWKITVSWRAAPQNAIVLRNTAVES